jgi:hypothetical protein
VEVVGESSGGRVVWAGEGEGGAEGEAEGEEAEAVSQAFIVAFSGCRFRVERNRSVPEGIRPLW